MSTTNKKEWQKEHTLKQTKHRTKSNKEITKRNQFVYKHTSRVNKAAGIFFIQKNESALAGTNLVKDCSENQYRSKSAC